MRDERVADGAPPEPRPWCPSRRVVLSSLGVAGLATALAACGGAGPATGGQPTSSRTAPNAAAPPGASTPAVLARTADVPLGGGTIMAGILIVQPAPGQFKAYKAACPHLGAPVGTPVDRVIMCPAHGSTFHDSDGSRISGPAPRGLTPVPIKIDGADIVRA